MRSEPRAQVGWQRLAGGGNQSQCDLLASRQLWRGQNAGKSGRRAIEYRRPDAANFSKPTLEYGLGGWPLGHEDDRRTDAHREGERVTQSICKEQLRCREAHVTLTQVQYASAV